MSKCPKRLMELDLPIRTISKHARREQNIHKGHLHTMHVSVDHAAAGHRGGPSDV